MYENGQWAGGKKIMVIFLAGSRWKERSDDALQFVGAVQEKPKKFASNHLDPVLLYVINYNHELTV